MYKYFYLQIFMEHRDNDNMLSKIEFFHLLEVQT